ncbi:hypothetical protein RJT34_26948 [Clitoria ternatea]|uniref:non-specific serine/threonine protein kinase n=1 Tax=Clitoria ternatea TaxID=43366 RepID=A0AAN9IG27_CLITE
MPPLLLPSLHSLINTLLFLSLFFPTSLSSDAEGYAACAPYSCGKFNISYPFWSNSQPDYCGHPKFKLDCQQDNVIIVDILSQKFQVIDMNQRSQIMKIARLDLLGGDPCPKEYVNVNLDIAFFSTTSKDDNYTLLYDCDLNSYASPQANYNPAMGGFKFQCPIEGGDVQYGLLVLSTEVAEFNSLGCKNNISVPVLKGDEKDSLDVGSVIGEGFEVGWSGVDEVQCQGCIQSGGRCGHNASINAFMCLCANQQFHGGVNCIQSKGRSPNSPLQAPSPRPISTTTLSAPYAPIYPEQPHKAPSMFFLLF